MKIEDCTITNWLDRVRWVKKIEMNKIIEEICIIGY
jgi:hypothetical protein